MKLPNSNQEFDKKNGFHWLAIINTILKTLFNLFHSDKKY